MYTTKQPIKSWAEDDRPREKMLLKGEKSLSNSELLAILIGFGTKDKSALELGRELLSNSEDDLFKLSQQSYHDLQRIKGIGMAKAITIMAALELGRRRRDCRALISSKINNSSMVYEYLRPFYQDLQIEKFYVLFLNKANVIIGHHCASVGGSSGTIVDGKVVFKRALDMGAHSMILSHNHPSGTLKPSEQDRSLTKKFKNFGNLIDVIIHDHIIYTDNGYYSFADEGIL